MSRRPSRMRGSRGLALIVVVGGLQLTAGGGLAWGAEGSAPAAADPAPASDPAAAAPPADPAQSGAPTASMPGPAATAAPAAGPTSVTVSRAPRAKASGLRSVSIIDFAFDPTALTVKLGDTVQWINYGTAEEGHNVVGDGLQSPVLHTGESFSFTFSSAGTFSYICTLHPKMTGTVEVIDPSADDSAGSAKNTKASGSGGRKSSTRGSGGDASADSGATGTSGSESAAVGSPGAAGNSGSLPATGSRSFDLALAGLTLLALGLALRLRDSGRLLRRG